VTILSDKTANFLKEISSSFVKNREVPMKASKPFLLSLVFAVTVIFGLSDYARAMGVGDKAPDFELDSTTGGKLKLSSLKGKNVLINFYVLDFSPT
jgi:hypothetical protein